MIYRGHRRRRGTRAQSTTHVSEKFPPKEGDGSQDRRDLFIALAKDDSVAPCVHTTTLGSPKVNLSCDFCKMAWLAAREKIYKNRRDNAGNVLIIGLFFVWFGCIFLGLSSDVTTDEITATIIAAAVGVMGFLIIPTCTWDDLSPAKPTDYWVIDKAIEQKRHLENRPNADPVHSLCPCLHNVDVSKQECPACFRLRCASVVIRVRKCFKEQREAAMKQTRQDRAVTRATHLSPQEARREAERAQEQLRWQIEAQRVQAEKQRENQMLSDPRLSLIGFEFEDFACTLFSAMGFGVEQTPYTGDGGKDAVMTKDGKTFLLEVKSGDQVIGREHIQKFHSAMITEKADGGFYVNTGRYTRTAIAHAKVCGVTLYNRLDVARLVDECLNAKPAIPQTGEISAEDKAKNSSILKQMA